MKNIVLIQPLKAGKIEGVSMEITSAIKSLLVLGGEDSSWNFQPLENLEDSGVVYLRPVDILMKDVDEETQNLQVIARLLGVEFDSIKELDVVELWVSW